MICKRCGAELPDGAGWCWKCGKKQKASERSVKKRGNGQGTVLALPNGKYKAVVTIGYYLDEDGKRKRHTRTKVCDKKKDAVEALATLKNERTQEDKAGKTTFRQLYTAWLPTHKAGKSTLDCYKAAYKYFSPVYDMTMRDIDVDDLQECLDDCPHGKRTKENMKAMCGLVYKYGIPRHTIPENLNLAQFLNVSGEGAAHRESFNDVQIERIKKACGSVPHAEAVYCMIYTGFRPSEFLALNAGDFDPKAKTLTGGAKTDAGKGRIVTISPKIESYIKAAAATPGPLFPAPDGKRWDLKRFTEEAFYTVLDAVGIDNPIVEIAGGKKRHKYTPHTCRHTFATLMKRVPGADKDKQELIGHASAEQLRYYQDAPLDDLRKITNAI